MKSYIPILFICLLLACHKENNSTKPQPQKEPDIYVTGYGKHDTVISGSLYWKNGFVEPLPGGLYAMGIAFIGKDIYVAGNANYVSPDGITSTEAVYWKNGVMTKLGNAPSYANGIMTLGSDVYIVGMAEVNNVSSAVYWENGILDTLSGMPNSVANAITASGDDIYIAGNAGTNGSQAVYWKNGIRLF